MAGRKGFLDLPAELRNRIYEHLIYSIFADEPFDAACMKRPGALIDRWHRTTNAGFYNNEIFQSRSAIVAVSHQIHAEFYPMLSEYITEEAEFITIHIADFDFQPTMDWLTGLSSTNLARYQQSGACRIQLLLDFEAFKAVTETTLKEWLLFATDQMLQISGCDVAMEHPLYKAWIRHGFDYPVWVKKYIDFVEVLKTPLAKLLQEADESEDYVWPRPSQRLWRDIYDALQEPVIMYNQVEDSLWSEERYAGGLCEPYGR